METFTGPFPLNINLRINVFILFHYRKKHLPFQKVIYTFTCYLLYLLNERTRQKDRHI